ncbi:unnamed protein product [marine sediment metagenome]|uniref:Uncharacterized protein n=1 Tax=marine sediment metagenome TaxID=412755 RepID=X1BDP1_9ZZZZ
MAKGTQRDAKIRLYDSSSTAWYLELDFDVGNFTGPIGTPKTEEILQLDRGKATSDMHYTEGPDDPMMAPIPISFGYFLQNVVQQTYLVHWITAMNDGLSQTVNSQTLESTHADSNRDGSNANPAFADSNKSTCDVLWLSDTGGVDFGWRYNGVLFLIDQQTFAEADSDITLTLNGLCYGTISAITAWPGSDATVE